MSRAELDAAGVVDSDLRRSYLQCRRLNARYGRTYFLATRLLTRKQRPAVHALYGFARWVDDLVDESDEAQCHRRAERLDEVERGLGTALRGGDSHRPVLAAVAHTVARYQIPQKLFEDFFASMRMDLTVSEYPDRAALERYMRGSAEAIGLQLLPVLGTVVPHAEAAPHAAALGRAFQLTNFLRDVGEDFARGRVYLPADELAAHGVDRELLAWCAQHHRTHPRVRAALAEQHALTRAVYRFAGDGIGLLDPVSRPCVEAAFALYARILDRIEAENFAVFARRAVVGRAARARVASAGLYRALRARRGASTRAVGVVEGGA